MVAVRRTLIIAIGAAAGLMIAPLAFAEQTGGSSGTAVQTPGQQNPGGRLLSGRIPNSPGAEAQQPTQSEPGTPGPKGPQGDRSPGAKLTTDQQGK